MNKTINNFLVFTFIIPIILLLWPFAMWNDTMLLILRIIPALAIQILLCRIGRYIGVKVIPVLLTGVLAIWGTYLYFTSPHWDNATFGSLIADYVSPLICCFTVFCISIITKNKAIIPK